MKAALDILKKNLVLLLILALVLGTGICYGSRKAGMHVDELYTYGLSNGYYTPFVTDLNEGGIVDTVISRRQLSSYLEVDEGEAFSFGAVYYNQVQDVHPPLYYWLYNIWTSVFDGGFSKWQGLSLDILLYLITVFLFYRLCLVTLKDKALSLLATLLYGLSTMGLSTMLFIRMYVLLTLFTVLLALLVAKLIDKPRFVLYPLIGLTVLAGLMTQYFFVFYAFLLCAGYVIYALIKKEYKALLLFAAFALCGALCLPLLFPACIDHLFSDKLVSGTGVVESMTDLSGKLTLLIWYVGEVVHKTKAAIVLAFCSLLACIPFIKRAVKSLRAEPAALSAWLVILPAALSFILVVLVSPQVSTRYLYNLIPFIVLAACWLLQLLLRSLPEKKLFSPAKPVIICLAVLLCLLQAFTVEPEHLYLMQPEYTRISAEHKELPCVYLSDNKHPAITQDIIQLMEYDEFFVTDDPASDALEEYLSASDAGEIVVYIDIGDTMCSGYDAEEMLLLMAENTGYSMKEHLYNAGLSDVYLLGNA